MACVALPAAAVAEPFGQASATATAANSVTYTDSTGEDPQAPDITTIVVSNNDAGIISFQVNIPNRPQLTPDMAVVLWSSTATANAATGDPDNLGADYVIQLAPRARSSSSSGTGQTSSRAPVTHPRSSLLVVLEAAPTIRISAAELGNTKHLELRRRPCPGIVIDPDDGRARLHERHGDVAPGGLVGMYPFEVKIAPATARRAEAHARLRPSRRRAALRPAPAGSEIGHGSCRQGRPRLCVGASREAPRFERSRARSSGTRPYALGGFRRVRRARPSEAPSRSCSRASRPRRASRGKSASPFVRRLALLSLAVVIASTGTASGLWLGAFNPIRERFRDSSRRSFARPRRSLTRHAREDRAADAGHRDAPPAAARRRRAASRVLEGGHAPEAEPRELVRAIVPGAAGHGPARGDLRRCALRFRPAKVSRRYRLLLDGFAVSLPYDAAAEAPGLGHRATTSTRAYTYTSR